MSPYKGFSRQRYSMHTARPQRAHNAPTALKKTPQHYKFLANRMANNRTNDLNFYKILFNCNAKSIKISLKLNLNKGHHSVCAPLRILHNVSCPRFSDKFFNAINSSQMGVFFLSQRSY